jgi:hypothetical protein
MTATTTDRSVERSGESNRLTELSHRARSPDFDLKKGVNEVLADVGMTSDDCGGELSFYGSDPILQGPDAVWDNGCDRAGLTWLVWALIHILSLPQLQNRLRVQHQSVWSYFTGQRSSRLIPEPLLTLGTEAR